MQQQIGDDERSRGAMKEDMLIDLLHLLDLDDLDLFAPFFGRLGSGTEVRLSREAFRCKVGHRRKRSAAFEGESVVKVGRVEDPTGLSEGTNVLLVLSGKGSGLVYDELAAIEPENHYIASHLHTEEDGRMALHPDAFVDRLGLGDFL